MWRRAIAGLLATVSCFFPPPAAWAGAPMDQGPRSLQQLGRDQQEQFVALFAGLLERSYLTKIDTYKGGKIAYVGDSSVPPQGAVASTIPRCLRSAESAQIRQFESLDGIANYQYPLRDPYLATMTMAIMNPMGLTPGVDREVVHVVDLPGRNGLPLLEGRGEVSVALYRQDHPASLLFIVGGIGSNPYFGPATYYAARFHQQGVHVVILPSPLHWNFALAASRSGAPGYTPADARDLYRLMQKTLTVLRHDHGVQVTGVDFLGLSLGALEGAYVSVIDADEGKIGIRRYLLANPPIDLSYALERLNAWEALASALGAARARRLRARAYTLVDRYVQGGGEGPQTFEGMARDFSRFSRRELQYLIAEYVHQVVPPLVYVTQAIHDQHLLAAPRDEGRKRLAEAHAFTLKDYEEKIGVPRRRLVNPQADVESLSARGSLGPVLQRLRGNPRVHIMHNADDILATRSSIEDTREAMGGQMTVYPHGGHLGNLWYPENEAQILDYFRTEVAQRPEPRGQFIASWITGAGSCPRWRSR
jgi:hypothetical protein